jgi:hypothetical protein
MWEIFETHIKARYYKLFYLEYGRTIKSHCHFEIEEVSLPNFFQLPSLAYVLRQQFTREVIAFYSWRNSAITNDQYVKWIFFL